jgi:flagellar basal body-associated protein FliL
MRATETLGPAWERMKAMLFRPFNIGTWFTFGFIFTLQSCVEGGGGNFNVPGGGGNGGSSGTHHNSNSSDDTSNSISHFMMDAMSSVSGAFSNRGGAGDDPFQNFDTSMIVPIAIGAVILLIPIILIMYWLGARGQMMAIRSVALGYGNIGESWAATQRAGSSLFKFHLVVMGLAAVAFLPLLGGGGLYAYSVQKANPDNWEQMLPVVFILIGLLCLIAIPFMILNGLARNFVAPLMWKDGTGARDAWKKFWAVGKNYIGQIVMFFFMRIVFSMLAGFVGVIVGFVTCCLGFLPVLHQTLMAPYYVFERAWTLEVLASMGPEFDVRAAAAPQGPTGFGPPPGFGGPGYVPGGNPYAPPGGYGPSGYGSPPPGGYGGGGFGGPQGG